jgi:hypothetical protein
MDKKFIDILTRKFPSLTRNEIEQACLLAELRVDAHSKRLAYRMVECACIKRMRTEKRIAEMFVSYDSNDFPKRKLGTCDTHMEAWLNEEEWHAVVRSLPRKARTLAWFAQEEAQAFAEANPTLPIWTRQNLSTLRNRVKQRFLAWEYNHSRDEYYRARSQILEAMRGHL